MFILDIIIDIVDDLLRLRYRHNLAICHVVGSVDNYVSLFIKSLLSIMRVDSYVLLNKLRESKGHINPLQVCSNKCVGGSNRTIGGIGRLKGQIVLVVGLQSMTREHTECSQNEFTGPKI